MAFIYCERVTAGAARPAQPSTRHQASLMTVLREWGRIGCIGFGGPPAHIALLRQLCVDRRQWLDEQEFEDAIGACNLLPGPASTELAIFCAWRVRGRLRADRGPGLHRPRPQDLLAVMTYMLAEHPDTFPPMLDDALSSISPKNRS
jgi:chromate transporter